MSVNPEEITSIIKDRIQNFETRLKVDEVGSVLTIGDGVARVFGLKNVMAGELVEFETGTKGMVLNLEANNVGVAVLGEDPNIVEGSNVKRTNKIENNSLTYNVFFDSNKLDLVKFENLIKNSVSGRNKISFFLIHNNKKIKIRSLENFNVDLNFMDKINSIDGIIDVQQFN